MKEYLRLEKRWLNAREDEVITVEEEDMQEIYKLEKELSKANDKLKKIHHIIHSLVIMDDRRKNTLIGSMFNEIDDIIDEPIIKESDK